MRAESAGAKRLDLRRRTRAWWPCQGPCRSRGVLEGDLLPVETDVLHRRRRTADAPFGHATGRGGRLFREHHVPVGRRMAEVQPRAEADPVDATRRSRRRLCPPADDFLRASGQVHQPGYDLLAGTDPLQGRYPHRSPGHDDFRCARHRLRENRPHGRSGPHGRAWQWRQSDDEIVYALTARSPLDQLVEPGGYGATT